MNMEIYFNGGIMKTDATYSETERCIVVQYSIIHFEKVN